MDRAQTGVRPQEYEPQKQVWTPSAITADRAAASDCAGLSHRGFV